MNDHRATDHPVSGFRPGTKITRRMLLGQTLGLSAALLAACSSPPPAAPSKPADAKPAVQPTTAPVPTAAPAQPAAAAKPTEAPAAAKPADAAGPILDPLPTNRSQGRASWHCTV